VIRRGELATMTSTGEAPPWHPILADDERAQALAVAIEIAEALRDPAHRMSAPSLWDGNAGVAIPSPRRPRSRERCTKTDLRPPALKRFRVCSVAPPEKRTTNHGAVKGRRIP